MGRLEQGRVDIFENLGKELQRISSRFPELEDDISRITELLSVVSKESVDPFLLRDQVVSFVQPVETYELQDQADSIARYSLGIQVFKKIILGELDWIICLALFCGSSELGYP